MSLINTQVQPFKAQAYKNGKFIEVTDADLKAEYDRIVAGMGPAAHGEVPPFEQVKQEVKDGMVEQQMVKLQDELRAKARIH